MLIPTMMLTLAANPSAQWLFDQDAGDAVDSSGNDNIGTLEGDASYQADDLPPTPDNTGALLLDGADDRVVIPSSATVQQAGSFTITAWARMDAQGNYVIISKDRASDNFTNYNFWVIDNHLRLVVALDGAAGPGASEGTSSVDCQPAGCWAQTALDFVDEAHPIGTWRHVAGVWDDATKTIQLYLDCADAGHATFTTAASPWTSDDAAQIGERKSFAGEGDWLGSLDAITLWPAALTAEEVDVAANCDPDLGDCGSCNSLGGLGDPCEIANACASGSCIDGVCCDGVCGEGGESDCVACSVAAGAAADGLCGPIVDGSVCDDGDPNTVDDVCAAGMCMGSPPPDPETSTDTGTETGMEADTGETTGTDAGETTGIGETTGTDAGETETETGREPNVTSEGGCNCTSSELGSESPARSVVSSLVLFALLGLRRRRGSARGRLPARRRR